MEGLNEFLIEKANYYNSPAFIETDPIQVPHQFSRSEDIEIAGLLTATLAWGQKVTIINNARKLISWMPGGPFDYLMSAREEDLNRFLPFVHRTFNGLDCIYFLKNLQHLYKEKGGLRAVFEEGYRNHQDIAGAIVHFREAFFQGRNPGRTGKHVANPQKNASGKRLNMFLRWMVRKDKRGVDFGLWDGIPMHALHIPLDVHSGTVARKLGLLQRKQNDWTAVSELTRRLKEIDPEDPVRFDFALFGLGSLEKF
jgi:uncharacterized protein (TIGR02757 family)